MQWAIAYLLFALACGVLAFRRHPVWALYFYLSTTYVHPPSRWWGVEFLPDLRWALLGAALCTLAVLFNRGKLQPRPSWISSTAVVIICLYAAWMWIQTPWALDLEEHLEGSTLYSKYLLALWFVYRIADTKKTIRDVMMFHGAGCALLGLMAHFEDRTDGRVEGVGGPGIDDANALGMFLATGAVVSLCLFMSQRGWRRWVALGTMGLAIEGIVMTVSRGAFIGLVAGGLVILLAHPRQYTRYVLSLGIVAVMVGVVALDQRFIYRITTIDDVMSDDEEADMSARSRAAVKDAQLRMAQDYPMGVGHRGTVVLSPLYLERIWLVRQGNDPNAGRSSHNTFLTALVEQGVVGAALFVALALWLLVTIVRVAMMRWRDRDADLVMLAAGLCGGSMVVFVSGLATDYLLSEVQFWLLGLLIATMRHLVEPVRSVVPAASPAATR